MVNLQIISLSACVRACECLEWDVCAVAFPATFRAVGHKLFPEHREVFQEHGYKW